MEKAAPKGVALGGFMATGKSTVGPLLAQRLGLPFWDLDLEVEKVAGMGVAQIFQTQGESKFRKMESEALRALVNRAPCVLALGGGTLHVDSNIAALVGFRVVVLSLVWEAIEKRLQVQSERRPLAGQARRLYIQREPGYSRAGTLLDVNNLAPEQIVEAVCMRVGMGAV